MFLNTKLQSREKLIKVDDVELDLLKELIEAIEYQYNLI
jgi:hypothetical protein